MKIRNALLLSLISCFSVSCGCDDRSVLERAISEDNANCPRQLSEHMTIKKVGIEGNYVCYWVDNDELEQPIDFMRENDSIYRAVWLGLYREGPTEQVATAQLCANADMGIKHIFCGLESLDTLEIVFPLEDIKIP